MMRISKQARRLLDQLLDGVKTIKFSDAGSAVVAQMVRAQDEINSILQTLRVEFENTSTQTILDVVDGRLVVRDYPVNSCGAGELARKPKR